MKGNQKQLQFVKRRVNSEIGHHLEKKTDKMPAIKIQLGKKRRNMSLALRISEHVSPSQYLTESQQELSLNLSQMRVGIDKKPDHLRQRKIKQKQWLKDKVRYRLIDFIRSVKYESSHAIENRQKKKFVNPKVYVPLLPRRHCYTKTKQYQKIQVIQEQLINQQNTILFESKYFYPLVAEDESTINSSIKQQLICIPAQQLQQKQIKMGKIKKQITTIMQLPKSTIQKINLTSAYRKVRKCFNVVLFIVYLNRFSHKMRKHRQNYLKNKTDKGIVEELLKLKKYLSGQNIKIQTIAADHFTINYFIKTNDSQQLKLKKQILIKNFLSQILNHISTSIKDMVKASYLINVIYQLCKHGSYSCGWSIHTQQQLDLCCLSQSQGYMRADSYLQKSNIISLVFIKIIIYNILLKPQSMNFSVNPRFDRQILHANLKLIANIIYEILMDIQDDLLEKTNQNYIISNWRALLHNFNIKVADSMTVLQGIVYKNQLISGLLEQNEINKQIDIGGLKEEKKILIKLVQLLHQQLISYHLLARRQYF